jgi:hypothetical protein
MVDTVFEGSIRDKSCIETYNFLRSHAIHHNLHNKEKDTRQTSNHSLL